MSVDENFRVTEPAGSIERLPIVVSSPHSGTLFPDEVSTQLLGKIVDFPVDTDWYVNRLYDFVPKMGITLIEANYSRYVVDLNRDSRNRALYEDSRRQTQVVPHCTFAGEPLYETTVPSEEEVARRLDRYYWPYYRKLKSILSNLQKDYPQVLLFDAHSIKHEVPSLCSEPFVDLILGDQNGKTAATKIIETATKILSETPYTFAHNKPFKGGHITRHFGTPESGVHGLQLEMCQTVYMDEEKTLYDEPSAKKVRILLQEMFGALSKSLESLT